MSDEITPDSLLAKIALAPSVLPSRPASIPPRYEVCGLLGQGGFGVVYDVLDRERGERVALKALHRVAPDAALRFKREFRALVDLRHPSLVRLHELGGEGQDLYFTMERLEGALPLDAWVGHDVDRLRDAVAQLASGLGALHAAGVLHRDLKPSNVLVSPSGRVVLLDFGLARELESGASTQIAGTPLYMAPEQCSGAPLGPAADMYALGVMMFTALARALPFDGRAIEIMTQKQLSDARPLASVAKDAPPELAALVDALLSRDPSSRPSAAEVERSIARGGSVAPTLDARRDQWVGRHEELATLRELVRARRAMLVRIEGPSGIGKTALLDRLCGELEEAWVLRGRCDPRESVPYKAFDEVIDRLARRLSRDPEVSELLPRDAGALTALFPVLRVIAEETAPDADAAARRRRGLAALRELFARLAERHPVVIAIDDLQWGDADSASLLVELLREPDAPRVTILATRRDGDTGALLDQLAALVDAEVEVPTHVLALGPLEAEHARALATLLTRDPARAEHVARTSAGHPLFLAELARDEGEGDLDALIRRRVDGLPPDAIDVLRLVVTAGHPVSEPVIARASERMVRDVLDRLVAERLVRSSPRGSRPYHDRVGELVASTIPELERRELHLRLAVALVELDADPEHVAAHFDAADDARAPTHTLLAAQRAAAALAFRQAAALFARTLELRRRRGIARDEAMELEIARADALAGAGRARDAADAYLIAAELAPITQARELRARAVRHLVIGGHVGRGFAVFRSVLDDVGVRFPRSPAEATVRIAAETARKWALSRVKPAPLTPERRARLDTLWSGYYALANVAPLFGMATAAMYEAEAQAVDSPAHRFRATALEALHDVIRRGPVARDASRAAIASGYADLAALRDPGLEIDKKLTEAYVEHFGMRFRECQALLGECMDLSARFGSPWTFESAVARALLSSTYFVLGDVPRARGYLPSLVVEANERDQLLVWILAAYHHWWVRVLQHGMEPTLERAPAEIAERWSARGNELQDWWRRIADQGAALMAGDPAAAYERISLGFVESAKQRAFATRFHYLEGRCFVARAAIALAVIDPSRRERLLAEAERIRRELREEPSTWTLALSLGLDAGIASVRRSRVDVERLLRALIAASDEAGLVLLAALARLELGAMTRDGELRAHATRFFEDASIDDPIYAGRLTMPGRFRVSGF